MLCIGFGEAQTGEGFSPHRVVAERTPHPTELGSTVSVALSHEGRGRSHAHRDLSFDLHLLHHSAASTTPAPCARSTTRSVVRMRWVVPSWKRITVSMSLSRFYLCVASMRAAYFSLLT